MGPDAASRTAVPGYAGRPTTKAPNWHGLVTLDLMLNNLSAGLFLAMAVGELIAPDSFRPLAIAAYPIALLFLIGDLVCLILDLGDPYRFHHMLRVWKPSSPMSLGTWVLTGYSLPLTALVAMEVLFGGGPDWLRAVFLVTGLVLAVGTAVYKGVLFSTTAQRGWGDARWLGGYLINSALVLGAAGALVLASVMGQPDAAAALRLAVRVLLLLNLLALGLLLADLGGALFAARGRGRVLAIVGGVAGVAGILLPLWLLGSEGPAPVVGSLVLMLLGATVVRSEIVRLPHLLGLTTVGEDHPTPPRPAPGSEAAEPT